MTQNPRSMDDLILCHCFLFLGAEIVATFGRGWGLTWREADVTNDRQG
jgi:hypothetical protein